MAAGDLTLFNDFTRQLALKEVDLDTDIYKFALVTNAVAPLVGDTTPVFGDYTEVSGTNYTAGGETVSTGMDATLTGATTNWKTTTVASWTQHASGPANIRWGILYNDQGATKYAAAFVVIGDGADVSLADGDISYTFNATAIAQITRS